ncbi:MAG: nucleotidyltransferase domain-containing protein [Cellulosilyticaceae bacterium]
MQSVEEIILETLPRELTEAIYLFGSYGTPYFDEATSDIDIGWYTNNEIDWFDRFVDFAIDEYKFLETFREERESLV